MECTLFLPKLCLLFDQSFRDPVVSLSGQIPIPQQAHPLVSIPVEPGWI